MRTIVYKFSLVCLICLSTFLTGTVAAEEGSESKAKASQAQLDQMMAPIALYPDALLSQVLMASTYSEQVTQAAKWSKDNTKLKGDDAVKAVEDKKWDPSVASLVAFPEVLKMMNGKPDWVKQMGDAFLADSSAVMDTVQTLRKKAKDEGNLKSTEQQTVTSEESDIIIAPTKPEVVYVPMYNPTVVYGTWWYPAYPPYYYPPPPHYGSGFMVGFGVAIIVHHSMWGGFNWGHGSVNINVNRYNNINVNNKINSKNKNVAWNPDKSKRGAKVSDNKKRSGNKDSRADFRGRDAQREKARANMKSKGMDPAKQRAKLSGSSGDNIRKNVNKPNTTSNYKSKPKSKPKSSNRNNSSYSNNKKSSNAFSGMNRSTGSGSKLSSQRGSYSNRSRSTGGGGGLRRR